MYRLSKQYLADLNRGKGFLDTVRQLKRNEDAIFLYFDRGVFDAIRRGKPLPRKPSKMKQTINVARHAAHAAGSAAKTGVGINRASEEQVKARLDVCRQCPGGHAVWKNNAVYTCGPMLESMKQASQGAPGTCGCILRKKARDLAEGCPFGWWPKIMIDTSTDSG